MKTRAGEGGGEEKTRISIGDIKTRAGVEKTKISLEEMKTRAGEEN